MRSLVQIFLGLLIGFNCLGQKANDRQLVEKSIHNFYDWYIQAINSGMVYKLVEPVRRKDGMTTLNTEPYFEKLHSLGTISQRFINAEKSRLKVCDDFLGTVTWEEYQQAEGGEYADKCFFLYYHFWLFSQEIVNGIKINSVSVDKDVSSANITFISTDNEKEIELDNYFNIQVSLKRKGKDWLITNIVRK